MIKALGSLRVSGYGGRKTGQDCVKPVEVKTPKNGPSWLHQYSL
jgi:hypothetical protein